MRGEGDVTDHKSEFQEVAQKELNQLPRYRVVRTEGPDHDPTFEVVVCIKNTEVARGKGKSKKSAEQLAAREALENLANFALELRTLLEE